MDTFNSQIPSFEYAAYIPCYKNGNAVTAIRKDGQAHTIKLSIKSHIKSLLKENCIDIYSLKKNYSDCTDRKNLIPIPLCLDNVLIPVKVRKTIGVNDGSYGYINLKYIKEITNGNKTVIRLTCGADINCLETPRTIRSRMKMGQIVREKHAYNTLRSWEFGEELPNIYSEYTRLSSRREILMLLSEIMNLRNKIDTQIQKDNKGGE